MADKAKSKPKKHRRDIAERLDDFVAKMLGSMASYGETVDAALEKFDCDERTVTRAIARVRQGWQQAAGASVDERRGKFLAELEYAWKMALREGDYRAIAVMAKTRADVEGIKAVKKVEHSGVLGLRPVAAMAPNERQREIDLLLAKRQAALAGGNPALPVIDVKPFAELAESAGDVDQGDEVIRAPASKPTRKKRKAQVH